MKLRECSIWYPLVDVLRFRIFWKRIKVGTRKVWIFEKKNRTVFLVVKNPVARGSFKNQG